MCDIQVQAVCAAVFSSAAAAAGQYFLECINGELACINQKFEEMLNFMHGEKRAELISEITFVQYARKNFSSIIEHDDQRIAAVSNLQAVKREVMRNMEYFCTIWM